MEEFANKGIDLKSLIRPHRYLIREGLVKCQVTSSVPGTPVNNAVNVCCLAAMISTAYGSGMGKKKEVRQFLLFNDVFVQIRKDLLKHGTYAYIRPSTPPLIPQRTIFRNHSLCGRSCLCG